MTDEPTTHELGRRFDRLEASLDKGFARIDARMDRLVNAEAFEMHRQNLDQRLSGLETDMANMDGRRATDRQQIGDEIDRLDGRITTGEERRAADRRNVLKIIATVAVGILGFVGALIGIFLPLFL